METALDLTPAVVNKATSEIQHPQREIVVSLIVPEAAKMHNVLPLTSAFATLTLLKLERVVISALGGPAGPFCIGNLSRTNLIKEDTNFCIECYIGIFSYSCLLLYTMIL